MDAFSLDQFVVFVAVVDEGGFAAAARKLGRAQSAITYAIKGLEEQSGVVLFDRSTYRPTLTDAGRVLLPRARRLITDLHDYCRQAEAFSAGLEASLTVALDSFAPMPLAARALHELHRAHPSVRTRLILDALPGALELVKSGQAQIGAFAHWGAFGEDVETVHWTEYELVPVAAPSHPLSAVRAALSTDDLRGHMQLVWTPATAPIDSPDFGVHSLDRWYVTDLRVKRDLLLAGVGWGSMPDHLVAQDLEAGRLVRLSVRSWEGSDRMPRHRTVIAWRKDCLLGPAARLLIDTLCNRPPDANATASGRSE